MIVKSETEIRAEIQRIDDYPGGSYEELAGAAEALRWVLGEGESILPDDERAA